MATKIKVKVSDVTPKDLADTHKKRLAYAKSLYASMPFVTKTWIALQGFPMNWVIDNWKEISS